ncbi:hypothetical protein B0T20DRAFT_485565 [Sordaria brevicollis]|uniref:Uncharacterized protein n=1 Tax=Sordaria brevicollis TaxID=83679 RepID=A0AAE0PMP4_SORBR|nr:hypothetical protein B0T20DRAFT_485565 [Sordaria brevicollis]
MLLSTGWVKPPPPRHYITTSTNPKSQSPIAIYGSSSPVRCRQGSVCAEHPACLYLYKPPCSDSTFVLPSMVPMSAQQGQKSKCYPFRTTSNRMGWDDEGWTLKRLIGPPYHSPTHSSPWTCGWRLLLLQVQTSPRGLHYHPDGQYCMSTAGFKVGESRCGVQIGYDAYDASVVIARIVALSIRTATDIMPAWFRASRWLHAQHHPSSLQVLKPVSKLVSKLDSMPAPYQHHASPQSHYQALVFL